VYDIDDDYWNVIYKEPKKADKKKKSTASEDDSSSGASDTAPTPQELQANANMPAYTGYDISVRQIAQDVLPQAPHAPNQLPGCPATFRQTDVLAYGPANVPGTPFHNWPAYTIEAQVRGVRWGGGLLGQMFSSSFDKKSRRSVPVCTSVSMPQVWLPVCCAVRPWPETLCTLCNPEPHTPCLPVAPPALPNTHFPCQRTLPLSTHTPCNCCAPPPHSTPMRPVCVGPTT
jgi:hypothetical protein